MIKFSESVSLSINWGNAILLLKLLWRLKEVSCVKVNTLYILAVIMMGVEMRIALGHMARSSQGHEFLFQWTSSFLIQKTFIFFSFSSSPSISFLLSYAFPCFLFSPPLMCSKGLFYVFKPPSVLPHFKNLALNESRLKIFQWWQEVSYSTQGTNSAYHTAVTLQNKSHPGHRSLGIKTKDSPLDIGIRAAATKGKGPIKYRREVRNV